MRRNLSLHQCSTSLEECAHDRVDRARLAAYPKHVPRAGDDARRWHHASRRSHSPHHRIRRRAARAWPERARCRDVGAHRSVARPAASRTARGARPRAVRRRPRAARPSAPHAPSAKAPCPSGASVRAAVEPRRRIPEFASVLYIHRCLVFAPRRQRRCSSFPSSRAASFFRSRPFAASALLLEQVMSLVQQQYVDTLPAAAVYEKAARGLVRELNDPYSELLSPQGSQRTSIATTGGRYGGTGMLLGEHVAGRDRRRARLPEHAGGRRRRSRGRSHRLRSTTTPTATLELGKVSDLLRGDAGIAGRGRRTRARASPSRSSSSSRAASCTFRPSRSPACSAITSATSRCRRSTRTPRTKCAPRSTSW